MNMASETWCDPDRAVLLPEVGIILIEDMVLLSLAGSVMGL